MKPISFIRTFSQFTNLSIQPNDLYQAPRAGDPEVQRDAQPRKTKQRQKQPKISIKRTSLIVNHKPPLGITT
jgi:hypothetical protein